MGTRSPHPQPCSMKKVLQAVIERGIETSLPGLTLESIPVELLPEHQPLGYQSPIALQLSSRSHGTPSHLAQQLLHFLSTQENLARFSLSLRSPGWIQFYYGDLALAEQLQALLVTPLTRVNPRSSLDDRHSPEVFTWQIAHARCCALLRLGHNMGLISLEQPLLPRFTIIEPDRIPWCDGDRLSHPREQTLIRSLLHIWDTVPDDPAPSHLIALTRTLSQDILKFDQNCRIWGSTLRETPQLALSRLGLVAIAAKTLHFLLEQGLSLSAPPEL